MKNNMMKVVQLMNEVQRLNDIIKTMSHLKIKVGRKEQVLSILENAVQPMSIAQIASEIGITAKNVSSQLTYIKSDGIKIINDNDGKKVLFTRLDLLK